MVWTEQAISEHLGQSHYRMIWDYGSCDVVDLNAVDIAKQKLKWTDEELVKLVVYKRRGHTMDEIEGFLGRDRKRIQDKWTARAQWMPTITVPDDPQPSPAVQDKRKSSYEAILSLTDANTTPYACLRGPDIVNAVCKVYEITRNDLISDRRKKRICEARHVYFWISRKFTAYSYPLIGRLCGDKDHSTVLHGVSKIDQAFHAYAENIARALDILGVKYEVAS